ncbi:Uncharacterized phosphosugar isomerase aq_1546 [Candidatus Magnetomoraceae bacterium gMMP-1]
MKMIIEQAKEVLKIEAEGILKLIDRIDESFSQMVDLIYNSKGRVIVGGIGKSGIVGRKIVATLNSTGTCSLFLHPVEAMHGDLGMVSKQDVFIALSNSGETDELNIMLSSIRKIGCKIIAFTGSINSKLAKNSDIVIDVGVEKEACPLGLAPTASTTATLAMGDALAVVLINKHHFKSTDFKKFHPGGNLGQRLSMKVKDLMLSDINSLPWIYIEEDMIKAIKEINRMSLGAALVINKDKSLAGIITDGDIRRVLVKNTNIYDLKADEVMTADPRTMKPESPAYDALNLMEQFEITVLPIVDDHKKVKGILHLHDILGKGEFKFNGI